MDRGSESSEASSPRFGMAGIIAKSVLIAIVLTGAAWFAVGFYIDHWGM